MSEGLRGSVWGHQGEGEGRGPHDMTPRGGGGGCVLLARCFEEGERVGFSWRDALKWEEGVGF